MNREQVIPAEEQIRHENILQLRRYLNLSQKEFLDVFMTAPDGTRRMSSASLSNIESKGKGSSGRLVQSICERMDLDPAVFAMEPETFVRQLPALVGEERRQSAAPARREKKQITALVDRLTDYFSDQMLSGRLRRGDQIPTDRELAARMGVGRTSIREALKVLDILGMIDIRPGQGTFVTGQENEFFMIPISWSLFMNAGQIGQILEVRDTLEEKGASLAALHRDPQGVQELTAVVGEMESACRENDFSRYSDADMRFHTAIARLSENDILLALNQTIANLIRQISGTGITNQEQMQASLAEHQRICGCIAAGDQEQAREAMHEHLINAHHRYNYSGR